jgi:hypothetical protein
MEWSLSITKQNLFCLESGYDGSPTELMHLGCIFYFSTFCQHWTSFGGPKEEAWSSILVVFIPVLTGVLGNYITCLPQYLEIIFDTNIRVSFWAFPMPLEVINMGPILHGGTNNNY